MMLRSLDWQLSQQACLLAALLSERDIFRGEARWDRDISKRIEVLQGRVKGQSIDRGAVQRIRQQAKTWQAQLQNFKEQGPQNSESIDQADGIGALLGLAYPDRIAKSRNDSGRRFLLCSGRGAHFSHDDALALSEFLVIAELDGQGRDARIQLAAQISEGAIHRCFADRIERNTAIRWDDTAGRAEALEQVTLGKLVLQQQVAKDVPAELLSRALLDAIRQKGLSLLPWSKEALQFRARVEFLRTEESGQSLLGGTPLPDWSDDALLQELENWLLPHLTGFNKLEQLKQLDLLNILRTQLDWDHIRQVDELAPSHYTVPSGSRIAIDYETSPPILAVRLQELFGLAQTPAVLHGRYPLMIHLLSPARRPVQITRDLANFWASTYEEVKKELRIKYQKHYWPDDPCTAVATNKTKKRMDNTRGS